jgi:type VI protein secretion system component VasK
MKLITRKLSHIELTSFIALLFVSIGIWVIGPHLLIAHNYPLIGPEKRFSIILLLFLGWLLFTVIFSVEPDKPNLTFTPSPEALKKLNALQGRFQGAIEFLKKTIIAKQGTSLYLNNLNLNCSKLCRHQKPVIGGQLVI